MEVRDNGMPISLLITWSSYFSPNHYLQNQKRYWFEIATKVVNRLQVNGGGCSTASLPKVWYFAILIMFWKILLGMSIFFYYLHCYIKKFTDRHARPVTRCYYRVWPLWNAVFSLTSSTYQKQLKRGTRNRWKEINQWIWWRQMI